MIIRFMQWNLGGCYSHLQNPPKEDLISIAKTINEYKPDLLVVQELHKNRKSGQAKILSDLVGLENFKFHEYDKSHIEKGQYLNQGIFSKYPILKDSYDKYLNPKIKIERPNGDIWETHDKGVSKFQIDLNKKTLHITTTHLLPLRKFNTRIDYPEMELYRKDIESKILPIEDLHILSGDFNFDAKNLQEVFPDFYKEGLTDVDYGRSFVDRRNFDFVLYKGVKEKETSVIGSVVTDRLPIITVLEL